MEYLEAHGLRLPRIGMGTWGLAGSACRAAVEAGLELGYRAFDTAQGYGNEAELGAALAASGIPRGELCVTTKVWPDHLLERDPLAVAGESLERLKLAQVDLLLLHWPSPARPLAETVAALERVRAAGLAVAIGVSNFPLALLREALEQAPIACNQVEYHPFLCQDLLLELCRARGIALAAYSPLARGHALDDPRLRAIAARHGRTPAQVVLRWLVEQPRVVALPKASTHAHLAENLCIFDFELAEGEAREIAALARGLRLCRPDFAPQWDG